MTLQIVLKKEEKKEEKKETKTCGVLLDSAVKILHVLKSEMGLGVVHFVLQL